MTEVRSFDHYVEHRSSVLAIAGQSVRLFVRERSPVGSARHHTPVLLVHGGFTPSTVAFDLPLPGYSLMAALAEAGFAAFTLDMTGYARSPRPTMDDPANVVPGHRPTLGGMADRLGPPSYPFELVTATSEQDDIDAVVDFVRNRTGADKVFLFGWSGGGFRTGTYTARHPEKVAALLIHASSNFKIDGPDTAPPLPRPGAPVQLQDRETGERRRWLAHVRDADQVEAHVPEIVWRESIALDPVGATWGPGVQRAPTRTYWGWNGRAAARLAVPTLVVVGEEDGLLDSNRALYRSLGADRKVFVARASATHFMLWEKGRRLLAETAIEWFTESTFRGADAGAFRATPDDTIEKLQE